MPHRPPTTHRSTRRLRGARAAGLLLLAFGLGVSWLAADTEPAPATAEPQAAFPWHRVTVTAEPAAPLPPTTVAAPQPDARATATPATPAVAELCGIGTVSLPPGAAVPEQAFDALPGPLGHQALALARERLRLALLAQGDARNVVAAHLLQRPPANDTQGLSLWAEGVLQAALAGRDPVALAWAEEACGHQADGTACRLALVRARIAVEPDNAQHWAALADEDPSAADEAWRGMVAARRWDSQPDALVATAVSAMPTDLPAYLRATLAAELTTLNASLPRPGEGFVMDRCQAPTLGRSAECLSLAERLAAPGASPAALDQAQRIGRSAGWSAERVAGTRAEYERQVQAEAAWRSRPGQPLACDGMEGWLQQFERHARAPGGGAR